MSESKSEPTGAPAPGAPDVPRENIAPAPVTSSRRDRGPRPPDDMPWAHQPGCTNPANAMGQDDWNCPCGPELIKG